MVPDPHIHPAIHRGLERIASGLKVYHQHDAFGLDRIPAGAALIAINHGLFVFDVLLLAYAIHQHTGRELRVLGDRQLFRFDWSRRLMRKAGVGLADPEVCQTLLAAGHLVIVAPGGMAEALRGRSRKYEIQWDNRQGFAREAIRADVPVVLAACPAADDLYTVYDNQLTPWLYDHFRIPVPLARGVGPTLVPRPVRLRHYLSTPYLPPARRPDESEQAHVDRFHATLVTGMRTMMADGRP